MKNMRTDLVLEARDFLMDGQSKQLPGVSYDKKEQSGVRVETLEIKNADSGVKLGKPQGKYITISLKNEWMQDAETIQAATKFLADAFQTLLPKGEVFVIGLGNRYITPDAVGPQAVKDVIVTRHLKKSFPKEFESLRSVCALAPGVLGITGIETSEIVRAICDRVAPAAVVAIDALTAASTSRLCRTFQASDIGITPGEGASNARAALNRETLGVPVIAVGVPTVTTAETLAEEIFDAQAPEKTKAEDFLVTPKDIDKLVLESASLIARALNLALVGAQNLTELENAF